MQRKLMLLSVVFGMFSLQKSISRLAPPTPAIRKQINQPQQHVSSTRSPVMRQRTKNVV